MNSPRISRRSFLASTLAAGIAPLILPGRIWSAEVKPNDRLTIGCIGIGKQMRGLMGGFLSKESTQLVATCDVDTTRRNDGKKQVEDFYAKKSGTDFKGCATYNDFRELIARKDIDAVVIATPDHWHALIAIAAAKAGKDIYCEKPLTQTIHEAWALVGAVRENQRVFQTGSMQRSSREFRVACELVRNGVIGKISRVTAGLADRRSGAICRSRIRSPGWTGTCGRGRRPRAITTRSSARAACTITFRNGARIANMAGAA